MVCILGIGILRSRYICHLQIPPATGTDTCGGHKTGTVGKRAVRILLECFLVFVCHFVLHLFLVCNISSLKVSKVGNKVCM